MATPSKSVQFRDTQSVVKMYENMKVPSFGIKQNGALNFKYQGDDLVEGSAQLCAYLEMLTENESAAIYTLAIYEEPEGRITEKTPVDLSWNFRLRSEVAGIPGEGYSGSYGQLLAEIRAMKKELADMKNAEPENKLGVIGEVMEMEAFQPILMAVGNKLADWLTGPEKVGELKRVSGVPGVASQKPDWRDNIQAENALDRLNEKVDNLPDVLEQLAKMAENKPTTFNMYLKLFRRM
jgi:hypothetical protein